MRFFDKNQKLSYNEIVAKADTESGDFSTYYKGLLMGLVFIFSSFFLSHEVKAYTAVDFNQYYDTGNTYPTTNSCTGVKFTPTDNFKVNEVIFWKWTNNAGIGSFQLFVATSTGIAAFNNPQATSSIIAISNTASNIPIVFPMNFTIASGTPTYFCVKASSVTGTIRMPGATTFYNANWIRGVADNFDQNAIPMVKISGSIPYTCPTCETCTTCPDYDFPEYPTEINQSPDISVIAQKSYTYEGTSSNPIGVSYSYYYIAWLQWLYIFMITLSIFLLTLFFRIIIKKNAKKK